MPDSVRTAQMFLEHFYAGEFTQAMENFGPQMRAAVNDTTLAQTRTRVEQLFGKPLRHSGTRTSKTINNEADIIYLFWDFEKQRVDARVIVNPANQIVALSFETPVIK